MSNEILTVKEATEFLRLPSKYSVYAAVRSGEIPGFKLNNRLLFVKEQLIEHLKNKAMENYKRPKLSALMSYGSKARSKNAN